MIDILALCIEGLLNQIPLKQGLKLLSISVMVVQSPHLLNQIPLKQGLKQRLL